MKRPTGNGLLRRFAIALGPGEPAAIMRAVTWAMICAAGLITVKLAALLCAAAPMLWGA